MNMGGTEKKKRYDEKLETTCEIFKRMYGNSRGFVKLMSGNNRKGYFYAPDVLSNPEKLSAILSSRRFSVFNMYASIGTFKTMKKATMDNLLTVNALAVDCDFTALSGQENISVETAMRALHLAVLNGYPEPSYIEYSRNIRLIYLLDNPYILTNKHEKTCKVFLQRVEQELCNKLNSHNEILNFNAEIQRLTSFIRIPNSINRRTEGRYDYFEEKFVLTKDDRYDVNVTPLNFTWDISKLAELVLPDLFENYENWKAKKNSKTVAFKSSGKDGAEIAQRRMVDLETLQKRGYDVGYREKMVYLYWIFARQAGYDDATASQMIQTFNQNFKTPLKERDALHNAKPRDYRDISCNIKKEGWERRYRDKTIRELIGLGKDDEPDLFIGSGRSNASYCSSYYKKKRAEKEKKGETKQKKIEKALKQVMKYKEEGKTWKEIAEKLGISLRTAKRYGQLLKEKEEIIVNSAKELTNKASEIVNSGCKIVSTLFKEKIAAKISTFLHDNSVPKNRGPLGNDIIQFGKENIYYDQLTYG